MQGEQVTFEFAVDHLHGCITVQFATGRRPVKCVLMAGDSLWYDGEGETACDAVDAAIASSGDALLKELWRQWIVDRACDHGDRGDHADPE